MQQEKYKGMAFVFDADEKCATHVGTNLSVSFIDEDARFGVSEMYFQLKWGAVEQNFTAGYEFGLHKVSERFPDMVGKERRKINNEMSEVTLHLTLKKATQKEFDSFNEENLHKIFSNTLRFLVYRQVVFPTTKHINIDYFNFPISESVFEDIAARVEQGEA
jgi:hypothetical protein